MKLLLLLLLFFPLFSLGQSPGGIKNNLTLWLKADTGIIQSSGSVSQWSDQSANALHVSQAATGSQPSLRIDTINYYPTIHFDPDDSLTRSSGTNSYNRLWNAATGDNVNTTGSIFTVGTARSGLGGFLSQRLTEDCGRHVVVSQIAFNRVYAGGRSITSRAGRIVDPAIPFIVTGLEAPGSGNALKYINGGSRTASTNLSSSICNVNSVIRVGTQLDGSVAEAITFDVQLGDADRRKVESYLAVKYGITIDNKDGGINGDYLTADSTVVWDASNGSDYHNRVVAIGRDDSSGLYQRQSHDAEDNTRIYLNTLAATNSSNTGSFSSNKQFILAGDNNAPFTNNTGNTEYPADFGIVDRMEREWKITNTGFSGNFSMDLRPAGGSYDASHTLILIDEDGDFSSGATLYIPTVSYNAGVLTLAGISNTMIPVGSTRYMTIVSVTSPGGVPGVSLWIKANEGVYSDDGITSAANSASVAQWNDLSGNNNHLSQITNAEKPAYRSNSLSFNYNPVVQFTNSYLKTNTTDGLFINTQTYDDIHLYTVHYDSAANDFDWLYYEGYDPSANRVSSSRDYPGGGNMANYSITTGNSLLASTINDIQTARTNIVGHHAGTGGSYGQANNRYAALMVNGKEISASSSFTGYTVNAEAAFYLGDNESGNGDNEDSPFTGDIGEVIAYLKPLTASERNRLESYLAIKYGKTLDNSAGGTDGDYLSSDSAVVWDASDGSAYHNDVIGLIRDNSSGLLQKQSHQADDSTRLYLSALAAANAQNTGTIAQNLSALLIGHNGGMLGETPAINNEIPAGSLTTSRLEREWKVTNTSFNQSFNMDIRLNNTGLGNVNVANLALLVDDDGNFDNAFIYFPSDGLVFTRAAGLLTVAGISTTMIPANTTRYITIARIAVTPGGVAGVRVWTKADAGAYTDFGTVQAADEETVAQWNDFSGNNIHLFQDNTVERPSFVNGSAVAFNYNPAIRFTNNHLKTGLGDGLFINGETYNDIHIYTVHLDLDADNFDWLYYEGAGAFENRISASYNFSSPRADYDITTSSRISTSTSADIHTGQTHIVGHHAGTGGNYGQANNRYGALMVDGREANSLPSFSGYTPGSTSDFYLGDNESGNDDSVDSPFTGYVGELLVYVNPLTDTQRNQVESYLAIKYGKTLDNSAGGRDGDYLSSTNTITWDADNGSPYHNHIIGIGRDDNSALYQRQSHLDSDTVRLYMGKLDSTNAANPSFFAGDEQFLLAGDNNAAISNNNGNTEFPANVGILDRIDREWKITNTNFTGSFSIDIKPAAGVYDASKIRILIDEDGDFSDAALFTPEITYTGGVLTLAGITTAMIPANNTRYLAVVTIASPGGVASSLWVKANDAVYNAGGSPVTNGEAVRHWIDLSGSNNHLTQAVIDKRPAFRDGSANKFNYNPVLLFTNSYLSTFSGDGLFEQGVAYDNVNIFTVHQDLSADDFNWLYYEGDYRNRVAAGYNFPGFSAAFYNVSNHIAEEASTETDIPANTVNIVSHHTGVAGNYGQTNDKYRALLVNGREVAGSTTPFTNYTANTTSEFNVGNTTDINEIIETPFAGYIGEIIVYKDALDTLQRHKIESYLAIKYGKTLDNSIGGTEGDYISSAATRLWDASVNSGYHQQVIGIGRDDNSSLLQKQSHTDDDSTRIYLSALENTNVANSGSFSSDNSFLLTGHNGEPLFNRYGGTSEYPLTEGIYSRIEREWKITNTNFTGSFSMDIKLNTSPVTAADLRLLVDEDGDFTNAAIYNSPDIGITYKDGVVTISGVSNSLIPADSTRYITIASVSSVTPLPLRLLEFTATKSNTNTIWLNWKTDEEINFSHFEIERSFNGTDWERIGIVQSQGLPNVNRYRFEDRAPGQGINYYRLKMVDIDTEYEYSPVRLAGIFNQNNIAVYPNPVDDEIIIRGAAFKPGELQLYDMLGRNLSRQISIKATGSNVMLIDASRLISGVYLLKLDQQTFKIIKR